MRISLADETLELLPERAIYWPRLATLFIADLHWGKAAAFRAGGVSVPVGTTADDLGRLDAVLAKTAATQLVLLGDILHARAGRADRTLDAVTAWRQRHQDLTILAIRGNHDRGAGDPPEEWGFVCVDEPAILGPFALRHIPDPTPGCYTLAGHLHPAVELTGAGRQRLRLPCWHFGAEVGVLPAFGSFTGTATVRPKAGDQVYVLADGEIIAVSRETG